MQCIKKVTVITFPLSPFATACLIKEESQNIKILESRLNFKEKKLENFRLKKSLRIRTLTLCYLDSNLYESKQIFGDILTLYIYEPLTVLHAACVTTISQFD